MKCLKCNAENQESRRFCSSCGTELKAGCPSCNFVNEPNDEFCGGCGVRLSEAGAENQAKLATNQLKRDCWVTAVN